jgi:hypothetical protein
MATKRYVRGEGEAGRAKGGSGKLLRRPRRDAWGVEAWLRRSGMVDQGVRGVSDLAVVEGVAAARG